MAQRPVITREELEYRAPDVEETDVPKGIWRIADPKITLVSMASLTVGLCVAWHDGGLDWDWAAVTVLGIFCVEAAKNASGEVFDWWSGTDLAVEEEDRSPFSGGKRVIVDGLMTPRQTALVAAIFYILAAVAGLAIVKYREAAVLWYGLVGFALTYFYHAPPFQLPYRGLGELAVGLAYGRVIASGAYLVQRQTVTAEVIILSLPLGLLIAAFLWINEFPDYAADRQAGKRTLVARHPGSRPINPSKTGCGTPPRGPALPNLSSPSRSRGASPFDTSGGAGYGLCVR